MKTTLNRLLIAAAGFALSAAAAYGQTNFIGKVLVFRCGNESSCAVVTLKTGDGGGWTHHIPKFKPW